MNADPPPVKKGGLLPYSMEQKEWCLCRARTKLEKFSAPVPVTWHELDSLDNVSDECHDLLFDLKEANMKDQMVLGLPLSGHMMYDVTM